jgi:hypothetical protein
MTRTTRREALLTIAAAAATPARTTKLLTPAEVQTVAVLVDLIIPRTDTPGATDAGVPQFIDTRLAASPQLSERFHDGLKALDAEAQSRFSSSFTKLTQKQQTDLLTPMSQDASTPAGAFFKLIKELTVDGYYTSKDGLTKELGWHGNTFLTEFNGCTHPEHQI